MMVTTEKLSIKIFFKRQMVSYDLSIGSTETKYIKLNTKTQFFFNDIQLLYTLCFLAAPVKVKVYKKVVKFSFKQQKIFGF